MEEYRPHFNESNLVEMLFNFHGDTQIFRVNTDKEINDFLAKGKEFDKGCLERVDKNGVCRIIYVVDTLPPLSAILSFIDEPFDKVKWGVYAVIAPKNMAFIERIVPVFTYSLNLTRLKNKFVLKVFTHEHRDDLTEVLKWMDEHMVSDAGEGLIE